MWVVIASTTIKKFFRLIENIELETSYESLRPYDTYAYSNRFQRFERSEISRFKMHEFGVLETEHPGIRSHPAQKKYVLKFEGRFFLVLFLISKFLNLRTRRLEEKCKTNRTWSGVFECPAPRTGPLLPHGVAPLSFHGHKSDAFSCGGRDLSIKIVLPIRHGVQRTGFQRSFSSTGCWNFRCFRPWYPRRNDPNLTDADDTNRNARLIR